MIWDYSNGFMDRIIYNGRALQRSPTCRSIKTIHRPNLVQLAGTPERMSLGYVSLLAFTPLHLQLLKPIQTFHSLLVHALTTLIQLQVNHPNVAAKVMLHDLYDRRAQLDVTFRPGLIGATPATPKRSYVSPEALDVATNHSLASTAV